MAESEQHSPAQTRFVRVFAGMSIPQGLLAKALLESEGIPVVVKGESEGPYRIGPVYLWVPEEFEVQARLVLEEAEARSTDDADDIEELFEGAEPDPDS